MIRRVLAVAGVVLCLAVGLVATANVASAQYVPGACGFIITPSSVTAGETVTITGQGFPAGSAVTFFVNGVAIASGNASADSSGSITLTATIPATLPTGTYSITTDCAGVVASQAINVTGASSNGAGNNSSGSTSGNLASTGADVMPFVKAGLLLLACGGLVLLASKRREHSRS